jgi:hypothetical protein
MSTPANVPIIDPGLLGENGIAVRIEIIKKYILATRVNWYSNDNGAHDSKVYLEVLVLLEAFKS